MQLFYIEACPGFLHISKKIGYLSDARISKNSVPESVLFVCFTSTLTRDVSHY